MTPPDDVTPERLEAILAGAEPRDDEERALAALVAETRALEPGAPGALRGRVMARAAGEGGAEPSPAASRSRGPLAWLRGADGRRRLLVAAPLVAGIVALAIAIPALDDDGGPEGEPRPAADAAVQAAPEPPAPEMAAPARAPGAPRVTPWIRVRVDDVDQLGRAGERAMATVRRLGGFTSRSQSVVQNETGTHRLVFRVPAARARDAFTAFARLGTVTARRTDLGATPAQLTTLRLLLTTEG